MTQTWHAHDDTLRAWADGSAAPVLAASVETHLLRCDTCRARVGALRDADTPVAGTPVTRTSPLLSDADRRWAALADEIDRPRSRPLLRVGLGTPALRAAWLAALAMLLVLPVAVLEAPGSLPLMLALAPVAPLAAVALAYGRGAEPAGEMAFATPSAGLRVVARRALLVSVTAVPLGVVAALAVGLPLELALGWLLPGAALAALVMLSGTTRLQPVTVAVLGAAWAFAVLVPPAMGRFAVEDVTTLVVSLPFQLSALIVAMGALVATVARHHHVAYRRTA